jgi:hypothetical protein
MATVDSMLIDLANIDMVPLSTICMVANLEIFALDELGNVMNKGWVKSHKPKEIYFRFDSS